MQRHLLRHLLLIVGVIDDCPPSPFSIVHMLLDHRQKVVLDHLLLSSSVIHPLLHNVLEQILHYHQYSHVCEEFVRKEHHTYSQEFSNN